MAKYLVIVESPAKVKTVKKYLGANYEVAASMGHVRDLPKSRLGIDVEHDFEPKYITIRGKGELLASLRKAAKKADKVYLATDPDREGEAISWHLSIALNLDENKMRRITFNEITKSAVKASIKQARDIDMNLVDEQQARRCLDRMVGYEISPLLWKKIKRGLSAGRVQSVALRIIGDREDEINAFIPKEYWTLEADLKIPGEKKPLVAKFHGKGSEKMAIETKEQLDEILKGLENETFTVSEVKKGERSKKAPLPFTTSTLQQEASKVLNFSTQKTMRLAQQLYEGVDVAGEGTVGLITYMRTDSLRISEEALSAAKRFILGRYGKDYYPAATRRFKAKAGAQDAHEAIRPSNVDFTPERLKGDLTGEQYRLYRLIWSRFLASQMANAVYDSVAVEIASGVHEFRASASSLKFSGYTAVYEEARDDDKEEKTSPLPPLTEGQTLELQGFDEEQHFTQPPTRYTDATLIRALEQNGIGRPSTYAPTVSTIIDREYVVKEGKFLRITPLGSVVTKLMEDKFPDIVDTKFTARMEKELDTVEEGKIAWKDVLREFYGGFESNLQKAEKELEGVHLKVPDEETEEVCPECGRKLVIKSGRFGRFLACPGYPECSFTMPLVVEMPGRCPKCGGRLMKRTGKSQKTGKQYTYYCCEFGTSRDEEKKCDFMTWDVPTKDDCPVCGQTMFKKAGKGFKKPFCINPACENFLPEDKRGFVRKKAADAEAAEKSAAEEKPAKKSAAKKTTAKTAAKAETAAKKTAVKKTAAKPAAKSAKAAAAKKTAAKKTAKKEEN